MTTSSSGVVFHKISQRNIRVYLSEHPDGKPIIQGHKLSHGKLDATQNMTTKDLDELRKEAESGFNVDKWYEEELNLARENYDKIHRVLPADLR